MATINTYDRPDHVPAVSGQIRSVASIVAIVAAIGSFVLSSRDHGITALLVALVAIGAGLVGGLRALSPRVSGGMLSIAAVLMGVIAIFVAILVTIF
jgi:hypothetical protein